MAIVKDIIINVEDRDALSNIGKVDKSLQKLDDTADKSISTINSGLGKLGKSSNIGAKGVKRVSTAFKGLGVAMKAAGIGLIIGALTTLKDVFTSNQRVADTLSAVFETMSLVFNSFVETVADVVETVNESTGGFDALKKVIGGLLTLAVTPLKVAFFGIKLGLQEAQLAWEKSFFGDKDPTTIKELNAAIKETREELKGVAIDAGVAAKQIYDNAGEAIGEISTLVKESVDGVSKISVKAAYETAKTNVELKNSAKLAAAQQSLLVEKYDQQAEKLRQIRDEERNSISDRKKANDELLKVLDKQEKAMIAQANAQVAAAQAEVSKNNSIENQVALTEALANKQGVLAQIEGFRSEQKANDLALDREQIELTNAKAESESKLSIERKRFNAEQIDDELLRLQKLKEIDLLEQEQESERLQAIVDNANAGTQAKIDAQIALDEFMEQSRQTNIERDNEIQEKQKEINAKSIEDNKKRLEEEVRIEQEKTNAKRKALDDAISLADAESGVGKALLIAKQALALKEMILEAKKTLTFGKLAVAKSAVAGAEGTAQTAKVGFPQNIPLLIGYAAQLVGIIGAVKSATSSANRVASSIGGAGGAGGATQPQAPNFNIVGATQTSQLAEAIGEQTQQPVQAYVVANDVTTAQSLENNIVDGATIG